MAVDVGNEDEEQYGPEDTALDDAGLYGFPFRGGGSDLHSLATVGEVCGDLRDDPVRQDSRELVE